MISCRSLCECEREWTASRNTAASEKYGTGWDAPAGVIVIQLPAGTARIDQYIVNGSGTLPRSRNPAIPAGSRAVDTAPPAMSAFTWEATRTVVPSFAQYSGLIPYGSRARNIVRVRS